VKRPRQTKRDKREQDKLSEQRHGYRPGILKHLTKILKLERKAQVKHQKCKNRQNYPDRIHHKKNIS
jgi:hypothetical protein